MFPFLGGLVGAGASLLGNILGQNNQANINAANIANQQAINQQNIDFQTSQNAQNRADQYAFAQNSVRYRVADANAAGINPLAALGMSGMSYTNLVAPQAGPMPASKAFDPSDSMKGVGQNLERAIEALAPEKIRGAQLENDLLAAKIANTNADTASTLGAASGPAVRSQPGNPPPVPIPQPNQRRPGFSWDVYNAKPLMEDYVDSRGAIHTLPTAAASSAMQNTASLPAQIGVAGQEVLETGGNMLRSLRDQYRRYDATVSPYLLRKLSDAYHNRSVVGY